MKKSSLLLVLLFIAFKLFPQNIEVLEKTQDSLKALKESYFKKITEIDKEILRIYKILSQKKFENAVGEIYICITGTNIYKSPNGYERLSPLITGNKVKVISQDNYNFEVVYNNVTGWVAKNALITEVEYNKRREIKLAEYRKKRVADSIALVKDAIALAKLHAEIYKLYGKVDGQKIIDGKIWLGMTKEMAEVSWGSPFDINRTVGSWGVHEQWVYGNNVYLYFENGKLTSWQD